MSSTLMLLAAIVTGLMVAAALVRVGWRFASTNARINADIATDTRDTAVMDAADQAITADDWNADSWWLR